MKSAKSKSLAAIAALAVFAVLAAFSFFVFNFSGLQVGVVGEKSESHGVGFRYVDECGNDVACDAKALSCGSASFWLPRRAANFRFVFAPNGQPYRITGITVFGMRLLAPTWLSSEVSSDETLEFHEGALGMDIWVRGGRAVELSCGKAADYIRYAQFVVASCAALFPWLICVCAILWTYRRRIAEGLRTLSFTRSRCIVFMTVATICSLPIPIVPVTDGLDSSWIWLINKLACSESFGSDFVFTYGPLGFLLFPQMEWSHVVSALCATAVYFAAWWSLALGIHSFNRAASFVLIVSSFIPHTNLEWQWVTIAVLCMAFGVYRLLRDDGMRMGRIIGIGYVAFAALLLPFLVCMKFSMVVPVAMSHALILGYVVLFGRTNRLTAVCGYLSSFLVSVSAVCLTLWGSGDKFADWFLQCCDLSRGYNMHQHVPKGWFEIVFPLAVIIGSIVFLSWRRKPTRKGVLLALACAPLLFTTVKYAIVRQGTCPFCLALTVCLVMIAVLYPGVRKRACALSLVLFVLSLPRMVVCEMPTFDLYYKGCVQTASLGGTFARVSPMRPESKLPAEWKERLRGKRIQAFPVEYGDLMGLSDIVVVPQYVLQMYSVETPGLDALTAGRYEMEAASEYIVCRRSPNSIDQRRFMLDAPRTFESIRQNYDVVDETQTDLLLRRRDVRGCSEVATNEICVVGQVGEWIDVPRGAKYFSLDWEQTALGRATTFLLRNTITFAEVMFEDGLVEKIRILPSMMKYPIQLNESFGGDIGLLWKRGNAKRVARLRFYVETPSLYKRRVVVDFRGLDLGFLAITRDRTNDCVAKTECAMKTLNSLQPVGKIGLAYYKKRAEN